MARLSFFTVIDAADFGIVINQHRTLIELDKTIFNVDNGFQIKRNGEIQKTPLQKALEEKNPMVLEDNVPLAR
ncbi:hypothetical protein TI05_16865 [Achromatium sp. WMS3]|nr:hypothetical protein TI05_16865 [Achromatium sp. WMS3]